MCYYLREFRGYRNGEINATFPLHWIDSIELVDGLMKVNYDDESGDEELKFVYVDKVNVK